MLHRLTLRVLPRLTQAVTAPDVRRRKRLVMLAPGLVAYVVYRAAKVLQPLSDPWVLLVLSGLLCSVTACAAYRIGRRQPFRALLAEDGRRRVAWVVAWIGFAYGVQLSLMVLALLRVVAQYDFLQHPDGPAMMAIIIACTSVARDAFEIGHVRWLQQNGQAVVTFPDGEGLRAALREAPAWVVRSVGGAAAGAALVALAAQRVGATSDLTQLIVVSVGVACLALWAYLDGQRRAGLREPAEPSWARRLRMIGWKGLFGFWWWPGLAFAATYYLSFHGAAVFVVGVRSASPAAQVGLASLVAGLMALYCSYLGQRRSLEDRLHQVVPSSLLRCPFVLGILTKTDRAAAMPVEAFEEARRG